jgi:hypothetical protein
LCMYTTISWSINQLYGIWVRFCSMAVVNSAVMNISVQVSLLYPDLSSFGWMPRSGITGFYGEFYL